MSTKKSENKAIAKIEKTLDVIEELSHCKPRGASARRTGVESFAQSIANWSLILSIVLFTPPAIMAIRINPNTPPSAEIKTFALYALATSMVLALSSLIAPILASGWVLVFWKRVTLQNFRDDIIHEQAMVDRLKQHGAQALTDAKFWVDLKIKRVEARITWFFGDKTAVLGLLATAYLFSKEFGGFKWLEKTFQAGPGLNNLGDTALVYLAAMIFGLSLGAVFLKHISARYRYQLELIDLSLR